MGSPAVWYQTADGIRPFKDGQTIYGSPAVGGDATIQSNPTETPGQVRLVGLNTRLVDFIRQDTGSVLGYLNNGGQGAGDGLGFISNSHMQLGTPSGYALYTGNIVTTSGHAVVTGHRIIAAASQSGKHIDCQTAGGVTNFAVGPTGQVVANSYDGSNVNGYAFSAGPVLYEEGGRIHWLSGSVDGGFMNAGGVTATGKVIARQPNGTAGTDEVQISHDGTNGLIESKSGDLRSISQSSAFRWQNTDGSAAMRLTLDPTGGGYATFSAYSYDFTGSGSLRGPSSGFTTSNSVNSFNSSVGLRMGSSQQIGWSSSPNHYSAANDTAFNRYAANSLELNNGTAGSYSGTTFRAGNLTLPNVGILRLRNALDSSSALDLYAFTDDSIYCDLKGSGSFNFRSASNAQLFKVNAAGGTDLWVHNSASVGHTTNLASGQTANADEIYDAANVLRQAIDASGRHRWTSGNEQTTVGAAGGADALPATPTKYLQVVDSTGAVLLIPAYAIPA